MRKKSFVTFFPKSENVHILKDVGLIPYYMASEHNYESKIVTVKKGEYTYCEKYTPDLGIEFIDGDFEKVVIDKEYENEIGKKYLKEHAKGIDILNLYHLTQEHLFLAKFYKKQNPKGFVYLKMDDFFDEKYETREKKKDIISLLKTWYRNKLTSNIDLITCESRYSCERFGKYLNRKIEYLPNGFFDFYGKPANIVSKKKNEFLTVGRLGTAPKNTELLLDAFAEIYTECDWNLVLVGSIEPSCAAYMKSLFTQHIGLENRVIYKGEISNKKMLNEIYQSAKVFLMPSRWENFSLAVAEAESNGCFLILSDKVAPHKEFTNEGELGLVVPSCDKKALVDAMIKSTRMDIDYQKQSDYAYNNFLWSNICNRLDTMLNGQV